MKERPSGGRDEKGRGLAGLGPENGPEPVAGRELEADRGRADELDAPLVRGRELEYDLEEAPVVRGRELELPPLLNDFFCSIYCSKRPVFTSLN